MEAVGIPKQSPWVVKKMTSTLPQLPLSLWNWAKVFHLQSARKWVGDTKFQNHVQEAGRFGMSQPEQWACCPLMALREHVSPSPQWKPPLSSAQAPSRDVAAVACVLGSFQAACSSLLGHIDIFSLTSTCVSRQEAL